MNHFARFELLRWIEMIVNFKFLPLRNLHHTRNSKHRRLWFHRWIFQLQDLICKCSIKTSLGSNELKGLKLILDIKVIHLIYQIIFFLPDWSIVAFLDGIHQHLHFGSTDSICTIKFQSWSIIAVCWILKSQWLP